MARDTTGFNGGPPTPKQRVSYSYSLFELVGNTVDFPKISRSERQDAELTGGTVDGQYIIPDGYVIIAYSALGEDKGTIKFTLEELGFVVFGETGDISVRHNGSYRDVPNLQNGCIDCSDYTIESLARYKAKERGLSPGHDIDGQIYAEGDPYPKDSDPNQEGEDPTASNAPTEEEEEDPTVLIEPVEAIEPDPGTPLPQGVGINDAVATDAAPATNTDRPEEKVIDNNAFNYTGSPLGLVNSKNFKYSKDSSSDNTPFSKRNFLFSQGNGSKGGNKISDNPLDFEKGSSDLHQDSVYDISTNNIIDKLSAYPALSLKWADFAYCRDFGVYPNNRLAICRRFAAPQNDDLTFVEGVSSPISTLVTWIDDTQNILEFNFGEEWVEAGASFVELLNEVGDDIGMKFAKLGDMLAMAANGVPLPGMTEQFQRKILAALGVVSSDSAGIIPSGTPNLIKESRQRKLIKDDTPGSGLIGKFNIKVKCSWEQKFISGVDPTLIYYDILHTILSFGGSQAVFYLGKKSNLTNLGTLLDKYSKPGGAVQIITDVMDAIQK